MFENDVFKCPRGKRNRMGVAQQTFGLRSSQSWCLYRIKKAAVLECTTALTMSYGRLLLQLKLRIAAEIARRRTYISGKCALLSCPIVLLGIEVGESRAVNLELYDTALTRLQEYLLESLELAYGTLNCRCIVADVELNNLTTLDAAGILNLYRSYDLARLSHRALVERETAILESGVAQTVTEGECRLAVVEVSPTITYEDILDVTLLVARTHNTLRLNAIYDTGV